MDKGVLALYFIFAMLLAIDVAAGVSNSALRSPKPVHEFIKAHPCPAGPDKGSTKRCRGYVVDHILPLCAGGEDDPENMQWQALDESRRKDKLEVKLCAKLAKECK